MMFSTILFPLDLAGASEHTIALAARFAREQGATLHVVYVFDQGHDFEAAAFTSIDPQTVTFHTQEIHRVLASTVDRAVALGARAEAHVIEGGPAWQKILDEAARLGADVILMQTHGRRGLGRAVVGSTTEEVLRHSSIPVLAVREPG